MNTPYKVGDRVIQWCFGIREAERVVRVIARHANVKNGRAGFDGTCNGSLVWGYDSDVQAVIPERTAQ
jgi:hypothetical protein